MAEAKMTSDTSPYSQAPPPPPPPAAATTTATRGWSDTDLAIGAGLVVLLIALFLPWFSSTVRLAGLSAQLSGGADGPTAHGFMWGVFVLAIAGLVVLVARDAIYRAPGNLPTPEQMLVGATGLALLLTILGVVIRPSTGVGIVNPTGQIAGLLPHISSLSISVSWSYGGFVALAAALVAFLAAFGTAGPLESAHRAARAALRRPQGRSSP
jgi:uncharacterized membrane protein